MGLFSFSSKTGSIPWVMLTEESQVQQLVGESNEKPVLFFKHSTRCGVSSMTKGRLESDWDLQPDEIIPVYLDLLAYRSISNFLASHFGVQHESPQVILIKNEKPVYNASHGSISVDALKREL